MGSSAFTPVRKTPDRTACGSAFGSLEYEHLSRLEIPDGPTLATEVETYRRIFNSIRPHEGARDATPH
jgi:hypothetical protein